MTVLDASAILAFLQNEAAAGRVEQQLSAGATCGAANWSEVAQKVRASGQDWARASALLLSYGLVVEPVTLDDAEMAAKLWVRGSGLSLADRLCLALGARLQTSILTCDTEWAGRPGVELVR
ncbi:MAG: PIN domain-containing protein [Rhodoglobus sp.]